MRRWCSLADVVTGDSDPAQQVALTRNGVMTRAEFRRRACAWHGRFSDHPGRRFAVMIDDSVEFAAALFGAWHAGKSVWLPADALPETLSRLQQHVDGFVGRMPGAIANPDPCEPLRDIALVPLDPDTTTLQVFTSGSSGEPVALGKSLRQLENEIRALEQCFGAALADAAVYATVSHQHLYGLLFRLLWPLAAGRPITPERLAYPDQILAAMGAHPSVMVSSPAQLARLPDTLDWTQVSAGLRAVFSSGGPLPGTASDAVSRLWRQTPIEVFGSTETGGIAYRRGARDPWHPLPGVEWRLDGERLAVRSPFLADADWYLTQDRAVAGAQGFDLLGRVDQIVKLEERRVSLTAIERRLRQLPELHAVRVVLLPGQRSRLAAVATLSADGQAQLARLGKRALVDRLRVALAASVELPAIPRRWRFVEALPANEQGKTTERALARLFAPSQPIPQWLERDDAHALIRLDVTPDLRVFDGHFPDLPVLPGVALLDWAIGFSREAFASVGAFVRMDNLKFQSIVRPGTVLELQIAWDQAKGFMDFRYASATAMHASGRVVFACEREPQ